MYINKRLISVLLAAVMMLSIGITAQAIMSTVANFIDCNLHTLAVKSDLTLWGWDLNLYGESSACSAASLSSCRTPFIRFGMVSPFL